MNPGTIVNWECNATRVALRLVPGIIRFLGYTPFPAGQSLPEKLKTYRWVHGLSEKSLAGLLWVDESTVARWERGMSRPTRESRRRLGILLKSVP